MKEPIAQGPVDVNVRQRHPTLDECGAAGMGPTYMPGHGYTEGGLKDTPEERERFEAYMRGHCWDVGDYDDAKHCYDTVGVRMLYGVWRDRGALPTTWPNARVERPHAALSREVRSDDGLAGTAKDTNMTRRTVMAHLAATMQCLGVGETCQGCERDMKRGEQWNGVEAEDGEPLGWHCDDCIADWQAGREIGATTKGKSKKIELNTGDMFHGGHAGPPLLP